MRTSYLYPVILMVAGVSSSCKETRKPDTAPGTSQVPPSNQTAVLGEEEAREKSRVKSSEAAWKKAVVADLNNVNWGDGPASLPAGAQATALEGTPPFQAEEPYVILLKFPANYEVPPHTHAVTERVTIVNGNAYIGHGKKFDKKKGNQGMAGGLALMPAGHEHFAYTKDDGVVLVLQGIGPWVTSYVNPKDDPRQPAPARPDHRSKFDAPIRAKVVNTSDLSYAATPKGLVPPGAQMTVLEGDPNVEGKTFTMRFKMPDGYKVPAHSHDIADRFIVTKGTLLLGMGDEWNQGEMRELKAPSMVILEPGQMHYVQAKGETELQLFGVGPYTFNWAEPKDDPSVTDRGHYRQSDRAAGTGSAH